MNNKDQPLVSVIMPVYNAADFLVDSIESILNQTYPNFELVMVDDASTDGKTKQILREYQDKYPKTIKVIFLKNNRGQGGDAAANIAYNNARGEFIARMDADDISLPERLEKQVEYMLAHPHLTVLGSSAHIVNDKNEITGEKLMPLTHDEIYKTYFIYHPMINPTVMVRRSKIDEGSVNDMYMTDTPPNNDYATYIKRISEGAKFANLPDKLLYYRIHDKNDSLKNVRKTFRNSLKTRTKAVFNYGYRPTFVGVVKLVMQTIIVYTVPQTIIFNLYLLLRGIKKPKEYLPNIFIGRSRLRKIYNYIR